MWDKSALIRSTWGSNVDRKVAWSKMVKYCKLNFKNQNLCGLSMLIADGLSSQYEIRVLRVKTLCICILFIIRKTWQELMAHWWVCMAWGLEVNRSVHVDVENWGFNQCSGIPHPAGNHVSNFESWWYVDWGHFLSTTSHRDAAEGVKVC